MARDRSPKTSSRTHDASLGDLTEVFTAGLPAGSMPGVAAAMTDPGKRSTGVPGARRPRSRRDARTGGSSTDSPGKRGAVHRRSTSAATCFTAIAASDVLTGLGTADLEADLQTVTDTVLAGPTAKQGVVQQWLGLLTLAHAIDRTISLKLASRLAGEGFYRAWMRYTVATIGIADDVAAGITTPDAASTAVLVAARGSGRGSAAVHRQTPSVRPVRSSTRSSTRPSRSPSSSYNPATSTPLSTTSSRSATAPRPPQFGIG